MLQTAEHIINIFGLEISVNPVAFTIPGVNWNVYWYGIIITAGFILAVVYGMKRAKAFGINSDSLLDVIIVTAPCSILSARLYYVIFDGDMNFSQFFDIHGGGLAIYGAVIGAVVVGVLMCKYKKIKIAAAMDLASLGFLIGQSIGRWGNFVNQEAYGTYTGSSWFGMTGDVITKQMGSVNLVHPCFLYESLWCAAGFILLHFLSKRSKFDGQTAASYLVWYGFGRFFIEGLRTDSLYIGGFIRVSQLLSALLFAAGIVILVWGLKKSKSTSNDGKYQPIFELNESEYGFSADDDKSDESFVDQNSDTESDVESELNSELEAIDEEEETEVDDDEE